MRQSKHSVALIIVLALSLSSPVTVSAMDSIVAPPATDERVVVDTLHGVAIEDPYRWLEDQNAPDTRAWIKAQNEYTQSFVAKFPGMNWIENRLSQLQRVDKAEIPIERGGKYFLRKRSADQEQYLICVRDALNGADKVLVDPHRLSEDLGLSAEIGDISADGKLLAYEIRKGGEDETVIRFLDVESGEHLQDSLPRALYFGISINADNSGFYYVRIDLDGGRVFYHRFGSDPASDELVFGGQYTPSEWMTISQPEDRSYLLIRVSFGSSGDKCEMYVKDVLNDGPIVTMVKDVKAGFYDRLADDRIYIMTNYQAPNWCLYAAEVANPAMDNWRLIIPERKDAVMDDCGAVAGKLFLTYLENGGSEVRIFEADGKYTGELKLPAFGTVRRVAGNWEGDEAFYNYSSFNMPKTIYRLDINTGDSEVWHRPEVSIDSDKFEIKQVWYNSKDGTKVPMWLAHKKDIVLDGSNPTYLTGYGGFNLGVTPSFRETYPVWLEMGGLLAYPCLRGGNEFGEEWHRAATFENKQNTFDDFIAAAEWLIENKYTSPENLAIRGGSNGGLLVGAVMNQRPELCQAVICTYPLLDMLRYHKFLMGPYWVTEYGSADNPDHFDFIYKYSPYHNVKKGIDYPAVMYVTGDCDTRVDPLHARKMTALMQTTVGSDIPVLLLYDTEAGHAGDVAVSRKVRELGTQLGFLAWQLGLEP
ncbi:MAG: S9 family peptidase [Candidatus Zixiibacteriota bacterium]|nr:MAG: S9 family peptidase [candidate division Zixibacteria bacterium]